MRRRRISAGVTGKTIAALTQRELEVVQLIAEGLTYVEIAGRLGISRHTVNAHMQSIFRKTGVTSSRRLLAIINEKKTN